MKIHAQFSHDQVAFDKDTEAHLVVSLTAPAIDWQKKRSRVCVIPVIDISGSMRGPKLAYAKQSAIKLIDQLQPGDYGGLVTFSDAGRVDFHPVEMTQARKDELKLAIGRINIEGGTNFSDGMLKALEVAKQLDLGAGTLTRIIMLTDGQPTHGIAKDQASLCALVEKSRGHVSVSAFGYGRDADQGLLNALAGKAEGNYAYIEDPDQALAAFGKELGGLLSTYAQSITIDVTPSNGHQIAEVLSDVNVEEEVDGEVSIKVPSLLAEETQHLVLRVKLAAQKQPGPRAVNAFSVKVRYETLAEDGSVDKRAEESKAKVQFVRSGEEQKQASKEVDEIVARAQLVKAQIAAEKAAEKGDFQAAQAAFNVVQADFQTRGLDAVAGVASHLGGMYGLPGVYTQTVGSRQGMRRAMNRGVSASRLSAEDEKVLLSANYAVSNSAQEVMTSTFTGPVPTPTPEPVRLVSVEPVTPPDLGLGSVGTVTPHPDLSLGALGVSLGSSSPLSSGADLIPPEPAPLPLKQQPRLGKRRTRWLG
jgi:Ca-activated chloride channel family protein